jgi:hypothetical protein
LYKREEELGDIIGDKAKQKKKTKFRLLGPLGQLHNIVIHTHSSASRIAEFVTLTRRMVPLNNRTQWNSWSLILKVALKHNADLNTYSKKHFNDLEQDYLYPKD